MDDNLLYHGDTHKDVAAVSKQPDHPTWNARGLYRNAIPSPILEPQS
ncbi:MAG: hypothetical protein GY820_19905 [Gammaproteobacteria bacterium]|nr:hypothetical protein [Gammaproteobacteria bacterium]